MKLLEYFLFGLGRPCSHYIPRLKRKRNTKRKAGVKNG